jgi:hypothetical protein
MRHLICIAALLVVFFLSGPGWPGDVSAHSVLVLASDGNGNVSKEETKAKAKACADKLPDKTFGSEKEHECPSSWNRCGNYCCPPDVPCWDYGAIKRAVKAGKCR